MEIMAAQSKIRFIADAVINDSISDALKKAEQNGIKGKEVTPFILAAISKITSGKSLQTSTYPL